MKGNIISLCIISTVLIASCGTVVSCGTVDVQAQKMKEIREGNKRFGDSTPVVYISNEEAETRERERYEANTNIIITKDEVFIPVDSQTLRPTQADRPLSREQVVQRSMQEAMVTPQNFIGGTQFYDYNEYKQYPVVCKVLGLTVIQLETGEVPIGVPYLSDTLRWEVTGDVWRTTGGLSVQLLMIKPLESGLTTNMILITNQRIYQFVLTSTRDSYMPMIKFRYPLSPGRFITAETLRKESEENGTGVSNEYKDSEQYLSYNYKIKSGWAITGWFKPDWRPTEAWDDGHKTYIRLPTGVLQREYPTVFEKSNYIINYRVSGNVMILDKLINDITLRLNGKRVRITKTKGEAKDLQRYVKREVEIVGDIPPMKNMTHFEIQGEAPWIPEKVIEYDGEIHIFFRDGVFNEDIQRTSGVLQIIDEKLNLVEYRRLGNIITIPGVMRKIQLAYNNQILIITRK